MIPCSLPPVKRENIKKVFLKYFNTIIFFFYERNIFYSYIILLSSYTPSALFLLTIRVLQKHIQNLFYFLFHIIFTRYLLMIHFLEMMYDTQNDLEFCPLQSYFLFYLFFFLLFFLSVIQILNFQDLIQSYIVFFSFSLILYSKLLFVF